MEKKNVLILLPLLIVLALVTASVCVAQRTPWQEGAIEGIKIGFHMGQMYDQAQQGLNISNFNAEVDKNNAWVQQNFGNDPNLLMQKMQEGMPDYVQPEPWGLQPETEYTPWQEGARESWGIGFNIGQKYSIAKQGYDISDFNTEVGNYNAWVQQNFGNDPNLMMPKMQEARKENLEGI